MLWIGKLTMSMAIFNSYVTKYQRVFINIIFKTFYLGLVYVSMKMAKMRDVAHVLSMFVFALGEHRFSVLVMFVIIYIYIIYIYVQMFGYIVGIWGQQIVFISNKLHIIRGSHSWPVPMWEASDRGIKEWNFQIRRQIIGTSHRRFGLGDCSFLYDLLRPCG